MGHEILLTTKVRRKIGKMRLRLGLAILGLGGSTGARGQFWGLFDGTKAEVRAWYVFSPPKAEDEVLAKGELLFKDYPSNPQAPPPQLEIWDFTVGENPRKRALATKPYLQAQQLHLLQEPLTFQRRKIGDWQWLESPAVSAKVQLTPVSSRKKKPDRRTKP